MSDGRKVYVLRETIENESRVLGVYPSVEAAQAVSSGKWDEIVTDLAPYGARPRLQSTWVHRRFDIAEADFHE